MYAVGTEQLPFSTRSRILPLSLGARCARPVPGQLTVHLAGPSFVFSFTANGTVAAWLRASRQYDTGRCRRICMIYPEGQCREYRHTQRHKRLIDTKLSLLFEDSTKRNTHLSLATLICVVSSIASGDFSSLTSVLTPGVLLQLSKRKLNR